MILVNSFNNELECTTDSTRPFAKDNREHRKIVTCVLRRTLSFLFYLRFLITLLAHYHDYQPQRRPKRCSLPSYVR
jgi:hypothetical protein